ncbi:hypothetical protein [Aquimarina pacifica]|uniref:hypothetical protein n=1 Tax=Aquimarina pacifica TaxID=1296415 RepID=UPI00046EE513|nr:hypothetical protein [Aquimarina pacifica]
MKNVAIIIILLQSFQFVSAQEGFAETEKFFVTTEIMDQKEEHSPYVITLVRSGDKVKKLSTLTIEDTELFEDIFLTTLENPGLAGVSEVIKMEVEYLACCAHVETFYYMVKEDQTVVPLPEIQNVYCENSDTDYQYIFPNQEHGVEGSILYTQTFYNDTSTNINNINLKQSFTWNDGTVLDSKTSAITGY